MENMFELPREGYVKLRQVLTVIPVSKSSWYRGIESGIYPKPVKLGKRSVGWDVIEVRRCMKDLNSLYLKTAEKRSEL